ncbi:hypothetical protein P154DRAFT_538170 [Amniculicola lignicola CBS 123094]|uniref:Uncharacterized protein n=1 Tax=Amniculicola lignicola CBS 123094 TaxID=1392246 RepID=A0A6A5WAL4_9PLEO|nr:hypothetical protein P154DRAFT_538170 [Amniculicola lignicola CBS 123094]
MIRELDPANYFSPQAAPMGKQLSDPDLLPINPTVLRVFTAIVLGAAASRFQYEPWKYYVVEFLGLIAILMNALLQQDNSNLNFEVLAFSVAVLGPTALSEMAMNFPDEKGSFSLIAGVVWIISVACTGFLSCVLYFVAFTFGVLLEQIESLCRMRDENRN